MKSVSVIFLAAILFASSAHAELKPNIEYGKAGGQVLRLDVNVPNGPGPFPVVIAVHGGGWCTGDKSGKGGFAPVLKVLTANHFTWFSIDYRLAPTNRWPDCFDDVQTAIRWVKAHAAEYKGDPNEIALLGYSAGGHLVCLAATLAGPGTRVQAIVGLAPPTDLLADAERRSGIGKWPSMRNLLGSTSMDDKTVKLLRQISSINHVQPGLPPFLLMQGDSDKTVPPPFTRKFAAKLKKDGVPCELYFLKGPGHRIADWEKFDPTYPQRLVNWLNQTLAVKK
ncbi:MAG TPA: alpha/beta hydrolase [Candidatus Saccharimonadales bacterium]|nr:alpha/beta hydrolase [Candidatus Saccharimonadales bacterium]